MKLNFILFFIFIILFSIYTKESPPDDLKIILAESQKIPRTEPAFINAEGFGAFNVGGKGGKLLYITTLEDNGNEGSLRWAVEQDYPRIIKFNVSGIIELNKNLVITKPFITIDGSDAPGKGITLKDGSLQINSTHDVIIRYIRSRPGDEKLLQKGKWKNVTPKVHSGDAISVKNSAYIIIDHCSASWSTDEVLSVTSSAFVTVQNCFITEPLGNPELHIENEEKISHPFGSICGGYYISYIKNLFAYTRIRSPQMIEGTEAIDGYTASINNFICFFEESGTRVKLSNKFNSSFVIINNFYKFPMKKNIKFIHILNKNDDKSDFKALDTIGKNKIFIAGNTAFTDNRIIRDQNELIKYDIDPETFKKIITDELPFNINPINLLDTDNVEKYVLENSGDILPARDKIDLRIIDQIKKGKGKVIYSQDDVGGYDR